MSGLPPATMARLTSQAAVQDIAVRVMNLPDNLRSNPAPVRLQGTVTGQNADGSVQVQTDRGMVSLMLRDRQGLPQGQRIEIDIPAGRPPQQAAIRPAPAQSAPPTTSPSLASTLAQNPLTAAAASALKLDRSASIKATEIENALTAAATKLSDLAGLKTVAAPLQAGQSLRLIPLPQGQTIPLQPGQIAALPQQALLTALAGMAEDLPVALQQIKTELQTLITRMDLSSLQAPPEDGAPAPFLPPNLQALLQPVETPDGENPIRYDPARPVTLSRPLDVQVAAVITQAVKSAASVPVLPGQVQVMPSAPQAAGAPSLPPQVLPAQITAFTAQKFPVISVTLPGPGGLPVQQSFVAQFQPSNLQVGSPLLISLLPDAPDTALPLPTLQSWMQPGTWDGLSDLLQAVHLVNPGMSHALTQMLPSPAQPQNVGALALFFLSVMRSGDLDSLLTPQVANLLRQSGRGDALRAIGTDMIMANRADAAALPQDWRAAMFPLYHDQQVHKIPLYYKRAHDEDEKDKEKRSRILRFLFDLKLSKMGNVQIDGFMQPQRLDMIMRTKTALSPQMQMTMRGLYTTAVEKSNLAGELTFQFRPEHWVNMDERMIGLSDDQGVSDHLII